MYGCIGGLILGAGEQSSNSGRVLYIPFHANSFGKVINPFLLSQLCVKWQGKLGSLAVVGNQCRSRKTLNFKTFVALTDYIL